MVEDVKELGTKLQIGAIPDLVDREILEQGKVKVDFAGAAEDANTGVAEAGSLCRAVSVGKRNAVRTARIERFFIAYDWGRGEATRIDVFGQLGSERAAVDVLAGRAGPGEFRPIRDGAIDACAVGICDGEVVAGLEGSDALDGPTSERRLSESIVGWKLWQLVGVIDDQALRTDKVVRAVS